MTEQLAPSTAAETLTVSQYSSRLGEALRHVGPAVLEGEIQKVNASSRSGMLYFDLTDGQAGLTCKVFARDAQRLTHRPTAGDLVRVHVDRPDLYAVSGSLSLIVSDIELAGEGELLRRRQQLLERLTAEGLCDPTRWRPVTKFPRTVAVIAGKDSHGMADVVTALTDRWLASRILAYPCLVQGAAAPAQLIGALAHLQQGRTVDAIIMARGGGSVQDLACFDDEGLCRALFACDIPVICAIGHTENDPVCNHVTWSAYTPSRSAEMAVPSLAEVRDTIRHAGERLTVTPRRLDHERDRVAKTAATASPEPLLEARLLSTRHAVALASKAVDSALRDKATVVARSSATINVAPDRAALALQTQRATVTTYGGAVARAGDRLTSVRASVAETGARLGTSVSRQLEARTGTYLQAFAKLQGESLAALDRRHARYREAVATAATNADTGIANLLSSASTAVRHLADVVAARDFRQRGWMLGSIDNQPVRSVADLRPGTPVSLTLHDGTAQTVVDAVQADSSAHNTEVL